MTKKLGRPESRNVLPDADFADLVRKHGAREAAQRLGIDERNVKARRNRIEKRTGVEIRNDHPRSRSPALYPQRSVHEIRNGIAIVGSDAHYWPGPTSLMHRAFVYACKQYKPKVVVLNGDVMDFPQISRHAPMGWEKRPALIDEIEFAQDCTHEIAEAAGNAEKDWTLGNHDARFETRLATVAPEYAKVHGVHLRDHFPLWYCAMSTWINDSVVIKHRFKGGIHATHNNTIWSGKTMVTGHLHSAKVTPFTDYNGTRYGVDSGCLADTNHKAFVDYTEDNPLNWRSAFAVLTFIDGQLMMPELVTKWDENSVQFRGVIFTP